ncbi:MAG: fumarylacetoacetate hydrolase family protein [Terricaulis sp.]
MDEKLSTTATRLRAAYASGAIAPLRETLAATDADGAYAIQALNTQYWIGSGRRVVGRKIGLTAEAVQKQLGVDQPDFGVLFEDMQIPNAGELTSARLLQAKAEAEIALVMGREIEDAEASEAWIAAAVDHVVAAIEIVDSRIADWKITFADTVADNGSAAYFVLGRDRRKLEGLDLYTCGMALEFNNKVVSVGAGAACLGHPLKAAAWLARTLAARGEPLRAGDIVLTGALGPMAPLAPGLHVRAQIGGVGSAEFSFV